MRSKMEGKGRRLNHSAISAHALTPWADFREAVPDNTTVNAFLELEWDQKNTMLFSCKMICLAWVHLVLKGRLSMSSARRRENLKSHFYKGNEHICQVGLKIPNRKTLSRSLRMSLPSSRTIFSQSVKSENLLCADF